MKISLYLLIFAVLSLATSHTAVYAAKPRQVVVAQVRVSEISDRVEALGTARANESVRITANVTEKVTRILFEDGQAVQANELLVVLEQSEEQASLERARAILGERELALNRLKRLEKRKLAATDELDKARLEVQQARASVTVIQARINDRIIRAPFAGVVGLRNISVGALVETGDLITTLDDTSSIKLDFSVPAIYLPGLNPGMQIEARATTVGSQRQSGEVRSIDSRVDPVSRSIKIRAILPNPDGAIVPGLLMQVDLLSNTRQALLIPESALLPQSDKQFVMVVVSGGKGKSVAKRPVNIGTRLPGLVEILQGLEAGEQVVTHGNSKVRTGQAIDILAIDDGTVDIATILKQQGKKGKQP